MNMADNLEKTYDGGISDAEYHEAHGTLPLLVKNLPWLTLCQPALPSADSALFRS